MMNQTKLLQSADGKQIIRVLDAKNNKALIIDCIHSAMPLFVDTEALSSYIPCDDDTDRPYQIHSRWYLCLPLQTEKS